MRVGAFSHRKNFRRVRGVWVNVHVITIVQAITYATV
eukprot:COSAG05_NODE_2297_length_3261_cov_16.226123_1_plen_36_part_10